MRKLTAEQAAVKLDLDGMRGQPPLGEIFRLLRRAGYEPVAMMQDRSPSGRGWHIILHVEPCPESPYEVIALQAILGGDRNREAMQMHRARCLARHVPSWMRSAWNVLYAPHPHRQRHLKGIL